jgi:hypothetical protein
MEYEGKNDKKKVANFCWMLSSLWASVNVIKFQTIITKLIINEALKFFRLIVFEK